jgi:hypothetical protein
MAPIDHHAAAEPPRPPEEVLITLFGYRAWCSRASDTAVADAHARDASVIATASRQPRRMPATTASGVR